MWCQPKATPWLNEDWSKLVWWSKWHRWQCSLHLDPNGGVHYLLEGPSWGVLMLALRSRLTGPGSRVGRPVAEVVVVHVEEIRLKSPGGKLRLKRCYSKRTYIKFRLKQCWQEEQNTYSHKFSTKVSFEACQMSHHQLQSINTDPDRIKTHVYDNPKAKLTLFGSAVVKQRACLDSSWTAFYVNDVNLSECAYLESEYVR